MAAKALKHMDNLIHDIMNEAATRRALAVMTGAGGVACSGCGKWLTSVHHARFVSGGAFQSKWLCENCK